MTESLEALKKLQDRGVVAIRSGDLSRTHRERLLRTGFLQRVIKGWFISARPEEPAGESTAWYSSFWRFCAAYLSERFGEHWALSPEQSLLLHAENWTVPAQLLVRSPGARNKVTPLPHGTSLFDTRAALPGPDRAAEKDGLHLFSLTAALVSCGPVFFRQSPTEARAALSMVRNASDVLALLLEGGHSTVAGRLAGAFRNIGFDRTADDILKTMRAAGYDVREHDPFEDGPIALAPLRPSPHVNRLHLMWQQMRDAVIRRFPDAPEEPLPIDVYLKMADTAYVRDAYHSLSIEGYRVSPGLIERVRDGDWNPEDDEDERQHRDALAARGYWQAYQAVKRSVRKVLSGENPGAVAYADHGDWYREMFAPSVAAGLLRPTDLSGYRNGQVFVRHSRYVPPRPNAVRDCMPAFFELLRQEPHPGVRVVLGHFIFVYIHPYMDGNGRMARFLMNVMLAAGGYPWTTIPLEERDEYMDALEAASVDRDIAPFARFLIWLLLDRLPRQPTPEEFEAMEESEAERLAAEGEDYDRSLVEDEDP